MKVAARHSVAAAVAATTTDKAVGRLAVCLLGRSSSGFFPLPTIASWLASSDPYAPTRVKEKIEVAFMYVCTFVRVQPGHVSRSGNNEDRSS